MQFDFNEASARITAARYDVCICGTGPAGITVARKLAAAGKKVLLLEGGDLSYTDVSQDIYRGESIGRRYWLDITRLRYFGGTSNHWSGRCGIFDPIDFESRDYFGLPGWPVALPTLLDNYLQETQDILDISGKDLSPYKDPQFPSELFNQSGFALSPPTRFAEKYGDELKQSDRIEFFYNASVVDVKLTENRSSVDFLSVLGFDGRRARVSASFYVLALGALENARLLMNCDSQVPGGVGNHSGMLGRCFMEHLNVSIGRFVVTRPDFWKKDTALVPTPELMRRENLGSGILSYGPNASPQSYGRLRVLKQFVRETSCTFPNMAEVARKIVDFDCPGDGLVTSLIEQTPNPLSRVSLNRTTDRLGLRRINLDWQISDNDKRTIRSLSMKGAQEMARLNLARVQLAPFITNKEIDIEVGAHAHQMGTTRMSSDPKFGVVNEDCRVHGVDNLYLGGSSVFPTGGGTNPTLTIVMLSLRLARKLSSL
ncbi:FAD-dependent oxidoreductase [Bradyrhizobium sp. GCM10023182]|uniref:GMC family oxidoreductase n=1 Tax=Bradyrhizobium zhengyangense TaxID=2911009 RepID=A0ABS9M1Q8_9BRAD|nr:GMC family oxidoreductase [Bradyrhizobium zhengyangense]MCG2673206.1 GMC family oxidoreductase [Bradyrhizobium zhengyangense]